jgi:hypothetical protein
MDEILVQKSMLGEVFSVNLLRKVEEPIKGEQSDASMMRNAI